jgi:hypothetical protein
LRLRAHRARLVTAELIELEIERVDQEHQRYVDIIPVRICSSTDSISSVTKVQPPLGSGCLIVPWIGERLCVAALAVLTRWLIGQRRHRGHEAVDGYTDAKTTLLMMSSVRFRLSFLDVNATRRSRRRRDCARRAPRGPHAGRGWPVRLSPTPPRHRGDRKAVVPVRASRGGRRQK